MKYWHLSLTRYLILLLSGSSCMLPSSSDEKKSGRQTQSLLKNVGERFVIENLIDSAGIKRSVELEAYNVTIIDFWFNDCPPCNAEMMQFAELIKGRKAEIQIISISVSQFNFWKPLFRAPSSRYAFLQQSLPNWQHLLLASSEDPALKNPIATDRLTELQTRLNVSFFPAYFVLDRNGVIIARPVSAVEYIKQILL